MPNRDHDRSIGYGRGCGGDVGCDGCASRCEVGDEAVWLDVRFEAKGMGTGFEEL